MLFCLFSFEMQEHTVTNTVKSVITSDYMFVRFKTSLIKIKEN